MESFPGLMRGVQAGGSCPSGWGLGPPLGTGWRRAVRGACGWAVVLAWGQAAPGPAVAATVGWRSTALARGEGGGGRGVSQH